jgi:hypothetical protein
LEPQMKMLFINEVILFSYQGVRMWRRIIPMKQETFSSIVNHIKKTTDRRTKMITLKRPAKEHEA